MTCRDYARTSRHPAARPVQILSGLRAITISPEWAMAIVSLGRRVENRWYPFPPALIGRPMALHAGGFGTMPGGELVAVARAAARGRISSLALHSAPYSTSAIVGLIRVVANDTTIPLYDHKQRRIPSDDIWREQHPWGWRFDFAPIAEPIPCRGVVGLWRVPTRAADQLIPQIPGDWHCDPAPTVSGLSRSLPQMGVRYRPRPA